MASSSQQDLLELRDDVHQHQDAIMRSLNDVAAERASARPIFEKIERFISTNQAATDQKLDRIFSSLSKMRLAEGHVSSNTTIEASTTDQLGRIFRGELRRLIILEVERCLAQFKACPDKQLAGIRNSIDQIAADVSAALDELMKKRNSEIIPADDVAKLDSSPLLEQTLPKVMSRPPEAESPTDPFAEPQSRCPEPHPEYWTRTWLFHWRIGILSVTITTYRSKPKSKSTSQAYRGGKWPFSTTSNVKVHFQPSQYVFNMRGLSLISTTKQDQDGSYYQLCPRITTFAVVPYDSPVMEYASNNNIDGLKYLFENRIAAPSDRTESGWTPLHFAARLGYHETCRLLLDQGADSSAADICGRKPLTLAQRGAFGCERELCFDRTEASEVDYAAVTRQLEPGIDLTEAVKEALYGVAFIGFLRMPVQSRLQPSTWPNVKSRFMPRYCELLRDLHLDTEMLSVGLEIFDYKRPPLFRLTQLWSVTTSLQDRVHIAGNMRLLCELGADPCTSDSECYSMQPLHWLFLHNVWAAELCSHIRDLATLFLTHGADPCAVDFFGGSPSEYAFEKEWQNEFLYALFACGMEPLEVLKEMERRKLIFHGLDDGIAESTAIDADVKPSFGEGLSRRAPIRGDRLDD